MKLVVGLGNPGAKYVGTRHNVGYEVVARLARKFGDGVAKARFEGELEEARIDDDKLLLLKPTTYMNLSGVSVRAAADFYKVPLADVLVVCDDLNLPLAKLRLRTQGSAGGQKGLDDVLRRLGDKNVPRLRIGIGSAPPGWDAADYVLGKFTPSEQAELAPALERAVEAVLCWRKEGIDQAMCRYNAD